MRIYVVGIGPGSPEDITPAVAQAIGQSDAVVGYKYYFRYVLPYMKDGAERVDTGMRRERERALQAFILAEKGKNVCVISSGDAGIYGMASLIFEMKRERKSAIEVVPLPGISAFQKAASLLGAPMSHDFCVISLSDLMTPWHLIERRIRAAATADFVTAIYNPRSEERYWQLHRLKEIFMQERDAHTAVGFVRQAGREGQQVRTTTLAEFVPEDVDMFTIVIIGNSQSYLWEGKFITPRGYYQAAQEEGASEAQRIGQSIMIKSFQTIRRELKEPGQPLWRLWPLLHAVHTTADFDMERLLWMDDEAPAHIFQSLSSGATRTIVTDVSMAASGIRKGALQRLGLEVVCYINDPRVAAMAADNKTTRAQAGIRLAVEAHPDALFAFGNAPTALLELCSLMRKGKCRPAGIVAAPVGFVHVEESKHAVKTFRDIPKLIIEGRKGGSNLAATLVNSILTYDDAETLKPGRDV
ncbi:MAG: precorrin-3B C(17)-methyltransferase [Bacteroidaceae bacterium]|nr:precorrin-3B C(17)-methyltransferase [Bacteroidaceae bacterium]